jgi:choline dehydrogenase-like flavoprotein
VTEPLTPDLCIIGAGAGGLAVAAAAAQKGAAVVLVERAKMGGDCLNFGCVRSKALLAAARIADLGRRDAGFGIHYGPPRIDFAAVADGVRRVIAGLAPHDSAERLTALGVTVLRAEGRFTGPRVLRAGAGDLILPWALAISQNLKIGALANLIVPYLTRGEVGKKAAASFYTPALFSPRTRRLVRFRARFG